MDASSNNAKVWIVKKENFLKDPYNFCEFIIALLLLNVKYTRNG